MNAPARAARQGLRLGRFARRPWPVFTLFVAVPFLLDVAYVNRQSVELWQLIGPAALAMAVAAGLVLVLSSFIDDVRVAAVVTALGIAAFFGHARMVPAAAVILWIGITVAIALVRYWAPALSTIVPVANVVVAVMILIPLGRFAYARFSEVQVQPRPDYLDVVGAPSPDASRPDIYFLIVDGYGRADVLSSIYQLEDPILEPLRERGFYVATEAAANYAQTGLALASVLNADYIEDLVDDPAPDSTDRVVLRRLIQHNRVLELARRAGYRIVTYASEYTLSDIRDADVRREPPLYLTELGHTLLTNTALPSLQSVLGFPRGRLQQAIRRGHQAWVLDDLARGHAQSGPTFVLAHITAPHPPFVWNADGSYRLAAAPFGYADAGEWIRVRDALKLEGETYEDGYVAGVRRLAGELPQVIDGILAAATRPTAIVLQSDHGPGLMTDWNSARRTDHRERLAILYAFRLPAGHDDLYPSITPVNGMRVVLRQAVGAELPALPDHSYFNTWHQPYSPVDVTGAVRSSGARRAPQHAGHP